MEQQQPPPTGFLTAGKTTIATIIGPTIAGARDGRADNGNDYDRPEARANAGNRDNGGPAPRTFDIPRGPPQPSDLLSEVLATLPEVRRCAREFGHTGFIWPSVDKYIDLSCPPGGN